MHERLQLVEKSYHCEIFLIKYTGKLTKFLFSTHTVVQISTKTNIRKCVKALKVFSFNFIINVDK